MELVQTFGLPIGMALFAVLALVIGWVVPGWLYREVRADNRDLRRVLYGTTRVSERAARTAERAVGVIARQHGEANGDAGPD
jgi:hypothetical protein